MIFIICTAMVLTYFALRALEPRETDKRIDDIDRRMKEREDELFRIVKQINAVEEPTEE